MMKWNMKAVLGVGLLVGILAGGIWGAEAGWERVPGMLERIRGPVFPDREFDAAEYGAKGDGETDCTAAFRAAIEACSEAGGGRVVVKEGTYMSGAIHLKSNINLQVEEGAVIKFYTDPKKYLPAVITRFEGTECLNYSPLIYAFGQTNIAVTGKGTLEGQGSDKNWWAWKRTQGKDVAALRKQADEGVAVSKRVFGDGHFLRPNMIQPYLCQSVLIEGVTIKNSPMWHIHPVLTENVTVRNVRVVGHGPNNDGCNPESSRDILIENCYFDTGDDCIAIKSGRNSDGRRVNVPSENIIIRNCQMKDGHGGVVIGSEMTGGVRNVYAENCKMDSPNLDRALRIKTNSVRGGFVENVYLRNIAIGQVREAVLRINFHYGEGDAGPYTPSVRNINLENVTSNKSQYGLRIEAYPRSPVVDVRLKDCTFKEVAKGNKLVGVKNLSMENVTINDKIFNERKDYLEK